MFATLRQRNFFLLWFGGLISVMGDWVLLIGLPIYVYLLTHSVVALGAMIIAGSVPSILLGSVAGVFVDRWDRRRTMVVTSLLLALGLLPLLLVRSADHVWIAYVVQCGEACLAQFFSPAQNALLPTLVGEQHLVPANALNSLSSNLARLVGPAVGGVIAATFGLTGIVAADALSFLLAALLIAGIRVVQTEPAPSAVAEPDADADADAEMTAAEAGAVVRVWSDWIAGLRVMLSERTLAVLLGMFAVMMLGEGVMAILYPVFVYQVLHGAALQIGELMSAQAIGGLIGGVVFGWVGRRLMSRWAIGLCQVAFGLLDLAIFNTPAFFPFYGLTVGLFVAVGIPVVGSSTGTQSLLQAAAPAAYRGRVFGALGTTIGLFGLLGTLAASAITPHVGVVTVLNAQGVGQVLAGVLVLVLLPSRRKHADPDDRAPVADAATVGSAAGEA